MQPVEFVYRNYKGETRVRRIIPVSLDFLRNPGFGYQPGWFLSGKDLDKDGEMRSFFLGHIILENQGTKEVLQRISFEA